MTWTDPRTWVTGEIVTAAQANTNIRDNTNHLFNYTALSRVNDLSDITEYSASTGTSDSTITVFDITGTGVVLGGIVIGYKLFLSVPAEITIDGTLTGLDQRRYEDSAANSLSQVVVPAVAFDSSAKLTFTTEAGTNRVSAIAWVKEL